MSKNQDLCTVAIGSIVVEGNHRMDDDEHNKIAQIQSSIVVDGLTDRLELCELLSEDGILVLARGHRRLTAIRRIEKQDPSRYQDLFGKGIEVLVNRESNRKELAERKADHGNTLQLTKKYEVYLSMRDGWLNGATEKELSVSNATLLDILFPPTGKKGQVLNDLQNQAAEALNAKDTKKAAELNAKWAEEYGKFRRGVTQGLLRPNKCPDIVRAALARAVGEVIVDGDGKVVTTYDKQYLPVLRDQDVVKLQKAHKADQEDDDQTVTPKSFGTNFVEAWDEVIESEKDRVDKAEKGEKKAKAMSANDMKEHKGILSSTFGRALSDLHMGSKEVSGSDISKMDAQVYKFELVKDNDPKLYKQIMAAADKIEAKVTADATVEGEAVAETAKA